MAKFDQLTPLPFKGLRPALEQYLCTPIGHNFHMEYLKSEVVECLTRDISL